VRKSSLRDSSTTNPAKIKNTRPYRKVGFSISRTNADYQRNPVYNAFHRFFFVETKQFVGSFVNLILTRQTCGQRSSRAAENKRQALGNYFSERICYMFLISKCREDWDLGLCTTSGLAFGEPQRYGKIRFVLRRNTFFFRSRHCAAVLLGSSSGSPPPHLLDWHKKLVGCSVCYFVLLNQ